MKVSIIIPAHNAADFIGYAIRSALAQTHEDIEVLVVDDGSTDGTSDIVEAFQRDDPRILRFKNPHALGPAGARNLALSHATGDWIAPLDSDDEFAPDRLEKLLRIAQARDLDALADGLELMAFETRTSLGPAFDPAWLQEDKPISLSYLLERDWPGRTGYRAFGAMKPIIRKSTLDNHKIRYSEQFNLAEDLLLYGELIICGARFGVTSGLMYKYYARSGSISDRPAVTTQMVEVNRQIQSKLLAASGDTEDLTRDAALLKERESALWFQILTWSLKVKSLKLAALACKNMQPEALIKILLTKIGRKTADYVSWRAA